MTGTRGRGGYTPATRSPECRDIPWANHIDACPAMAKGRRTAEAMKKGACQITRHLDKDHPEIVVEHIISDRLHDVPRPDIDLRIRYGTGEWPGETAAKIQSDVVVAVASPDFPSRHPVDDLAALSAAPLLSVEGADWVWMTWSSFLRQAGAPFHRLNVRRFNSYVVALQAARNGQGVSLGWMSLARPLIESGDLRQVTETQISDPNAFFVTWSDRRNLSAETVVLRDWLLAQGALS